MQMRRDWIWISGNHDPALPDDLGGVVASEVAIGPIVFRHEPTGAAGEIAGHLHPKARVPTRGRTDGAALLCLRRRARRDAGVRCLCRRPEHPRQGLLQDIPDPRFHGACARRQPAACASPPRAVTDPASCMRSLRSTPAPRPEPNAVRNRCRGGWERAWQIARRPITRTTKKTAGAKPALKDEPPSPSASAVSESARTGTDHRRIRRRSLRHRHLQPGRRAARLRHRLDHAADVSADGGDPGNLRAGRARHRAGHLRQCLPALFDVAAQCRGGAAVHRQHHQHRRRSRRDGGCDQAPDRRSRHALCGGVRGDIGGGADFPRLQAATCRC